MPKTIDNDLVCNDHTPGFPSAARFVAQAFAGANLDNAALPGVYVAVVMGRHAGFLTAASALGRTFPDDGPHLIYLPERSFSIDSFLADVKATHERLGRCVVAVSEGIHDSAGQPILAQLAGQLERDAHGNVQLSGSGALADLLCDKVKATLGLKRVRGDTFGYLQRSFLGCVSDVDAREAREVGERAVQFALLGNEDGSVAMRRSGDYAVAYDLVPLEDVAGKTKVMHDSFIAASGTDVTGAFRDYLRPLLGSRHAAGASAARRGGGQGAQGGRLKGEGPLRRPSRRFRPPAARDRSPHAPRRSTRCVPPRARWPRARHCGRARRAGRHGPSSAPRVLRRWG